MAALEYKCINSGINSYMAKAYTSRLAFEDDDDAESPSSESEKCGSSNSSSRTSSASSRQSTGSGANDVTLRGERASFSNAEKRSSQNQESNTCTTSISESPSKNDIKSFFLAKSMEERYPPPTVRNSEDLDSLFLASSLRISSPDGAEDSSIPPVPARKKSVKMQVKSKVNEATSRVEKLKFKIRRQYSKKKVHQLDFERLESNNNEIIDSSESSNRSSLESDNVDTEEKNDTVFSDKTTSIGKLGKDSLIVQELECHDNEVTDD